MRFSWLNIRKRLNSAKFIQVLGSLLILLFILGEQVGFWPSHILKRFEWLAYDERVNATLPKIEDPSIIIVDIDERSLQAVGQWPWPRQYIAELLIQLFEDYQVQMVGLDIIFAEPENNVLQIHWEALKNKYPELPNQPSIHTGDTLLSEVFAGYPVVSAFYFEQSSKNDYTSVGELPHPLQVNTPPEMLQAIPWVKPQRFTSNHHALQSKTITSGYFDNPLVDSDGVFRKVPLVQLWHDGLYPSLPLAMLYQLFGQPPLNLDIQSGGGQLQLEGIELGGFYFPTDPQGAVLVPWAGPREHFNYISAFDVLQGAAPLAQLRGSIVLLGTSAPGLMDLRSTPVGGVYPGVEIHANILAGMLQMNFRSEPGYSIAITALGLLTVGLLITFIFPRIKALVLFGMSSLLIFLHLGTNLYAWQQGLVLPLASGLLLLVLLSIWHLGMSFWRESHAKKQVAQQFGLYIPPELVADIVNAPEALDMQGKEAELSVLFSDIRGFTSFSEQIPPAELTSVMNRLLTPITEAIHQQQGTIDKYMGDAVMAFWGAPLSNPQHATQALKGALAMQAALEAINESFKQESRPTLAMGIGVHTGLMNVGNMGSEFRMAYTVMGDNVNLGSRLESITKNYGIKILVSDETRRQTFSHSEPSPLFLFRPVDHIRVKGRETPVKIYELLGYYTTASQRTKDYATHFEKILTLYNQQNFQTALTELQLYLNTWPEDMLAKIYLQRCEAFINTPPSSDWDGVYTHQSK